MTTSTYSIGVTSVTGEARMLVPICRQLQRSKPYAALTLVITGVDWRGGRARYEVQDPEGKQVSSGVQAIRVSDGVDRVVSAISPDAAHLATQFGRVT